MVTWSELFVFMTFMVALIDLIVTIVYINKKK